VAEAADAEEEGVMPTVRVCNNCGRAADVLVHVTVIGPDNPKGERRDLCPTCSDALGVGANNFSKEIAQAKAGVASMKEAAMTPPPREDFPVTYVCQRCGRNQSTVHIHEQRRGLSGQVHLCTECARGTI
jgi:protein-arginine kinase activator protein McsA